MAHKDRCSSCCRSHHTDLVTLRELWSSARGHLVEILWARALVPVRCSKAVTSSARTNRLVVIYPLVLGNKVFNDLLESKIRYEIVLRQRRPGQRVKMTDALKDATKTINLIKQWWIDTHAQMHSANKAITKELKMDRIYIQSGWSVGHLSGVKTSWSRLKWFPFYFLSTCQDYAVPETPGRANNIGLITTTAGSMWHENKTKKYNALPPGDQFKQNQTVDNILSSLLTSKLL